MLSRHHTLERNRRREILTATLLAAIVASCDEIVVTPADVATIRVQPEQAEVSQGEAIQLDAELQDEQGRVITGHTIVWVSDDEGIAAVDEAGQVSGVRNGTTTIRAHVGTAEGRAEVRVLAPPSIALSPAVISRAMDSGAAPPPPVNVAITNAADGQLTGLNVSTDYGAGPAGWLSTELSGSTAPATLMIRFDGSSSLAPGEYQATIQVSASSAPGGPVPLVVSLEVRPPPPPAAPSNLRAEIVQRSRVRLAWNNNSATEPVFHIERALGSGTFTLLDVTREGALFYDDRSVTPSTTYRYRVMACNEGGCSDWSNTISVTTPD
jgi:hypothetical protein